MSGQIWVAGQAGFVLQEIKFISLRLNNGEMALEIIPEWSFPVNWSHASQRWRTEKNTCSNQHALNTWSNLSRRTDGHLQNTQISVHIVLTTVC